MCAASEVIKLGEAFWDWMPGVRFKSCIRGQAREIVLGIDVRCCIRGGQDRESVLGVIARCQINIQESALHPRWSSSGQRVGSKCQMSDSRTASDVELGEPCWDDMSGAASDVVTLGQAFWD